MLQMKLLYKGYFDASCRPEMTVCASYIEQSSKVIHKGIKIYQPPNNITNSYKAELIALSNLLVHIWDHIEPKNHIKIYGDAKGVIDVVNKGITLKDIDLIEKVNYLKKYYTLEFCFIPRQKNYKADILTKLKSAEALDSIDLDSGNISFERVEICLKDIVLPNYLKYNSSPNETKYQKKYNHFINTGEFKTPISVDENFLLLDGYITYLILNRLGIETYSVDVYHIKEIAV